MVLPFADARRVVEEHAGALRATAAEPVALVHALRRVLAQDIAADRDQPPFPRATRDGFAVRAADLATAPARLQVVAEIKAGTPSHLTIGPGQAAEIMTGAPVPAGADAVVMMEHTTRDGDVIEVPRAGSPGENVVPVGAEARKGDVLLPRGTRMGAAQIAAAAATGHAQVYVYLRPRVAILATGDELVDVAAEPGPAQIRNSNSYSLAAQVLAAGAEPVQLPIAPDEPDALRRLLKQGLSADLLLLSGGVSAGKYDLVEDALGEFSAEFFFTGALIQPGRPVVFGQARHAPYAAATCFFGLPGNPVSTLVTFTLFVRPVLEALSGASPQPLRFVTARLASDFRTKTGLTRFLPARYVGDMAETTVELVRWQGSGDIAAASRADCLLVVPPDREQFFAGESLSVLVD